MDQEIGIQENMTQQLLNKEYSTFTSYIKKVKQFYSKEKNYPNVSLTN
ncbi:unnamed protein product [Paramecium octaurelia]|uniref:Uncharacterized protein n=1 Tax=Paramecium octaurelia TaxID=43137 RepID=A0A8S1VN59_PAROT|nr:unnamed protein product [Paramecium octaurelia]